MSNLPQYYIRLDVTLKCGVQQTVLVPSPKGLEETRKNCETFVEEFDMLARVYGENAMTTNSHFSIDTESIAMFVATVIDQLP
jgi:hypothetical protein